MSMPEPQAIADYLSHNPHFFNDFPELAASLRIPHPHGTHAISMSERQLIALRDKVRLLENRLAELIQFGEENDGISDKLHLLARDLMAAADLDAVKAILARHLAEGFAVRWHVLRLLPDTRLDETALTAIQTLDTPACGAPAVPGSPDWFGETPVPLASYASLPLRAHAGAPALGVLVLASDDPRRYYSGMGTLFLARLGELLAAAVSRCQPR